MNHDDEQIEQSAEDDQLNVDLRGNTDEADIGQPVDSELENIIEAA